MSLPSEAIAASSRLRTPKSWRMAAPIAMVGVPVMLVVVMGFTFWVTSTMRHAVGLVKNSIEVSDYYEAARFAVDEEVALERRYRYRPSVDARDEHRAASLRFTSSLDAVRHTGDATDRLVVERALRAHARRIGAALLGFAAVDRHQLERARIIKQSAGDPATLLLEKHLAGAASLRKAQAVQRLNALEQFAAMVSAIIPLAFVLGALLLVSFSIVLRNYRLHVQNSVRYEIESIKATTDSEIERIKTALEAERQTVRVSEAMRATELAETANTAKSEFLSRMSHELRTPLNAILGFGQLLDRTDLEPDQKESVQYILKGGRHLLNLINEVLDIARVEAGRAELSIEPIALADVVPDACALVRPLASERGIEVQDNTESVGNIYLMADHQRLKQVLLNLLSNAIKYNRAGGKVDVMSSVTAAGRIRIAVHDTGPGISAADMAKLFTPFERLGAINSDIEGSGLGLLLSQRLMTVMGGTLELTSSEGQGSTFTLEFRPAVAPIGLLDTMHGSAEADAGGASSRRYTVLCIEDNPSNLRLLEVIFAKRPNMTLLSAMQGSVGLDLARVHEPDIILLDLNLPDMHGREVMTRLKQSALTCDIPVIVVSADATVAQIEKLTAAGAVAYVTKPLNVAAFLRVLDDALDENDMHAQTAREKAIVTP